MIGGEFCCSLTARPLQPPHIVSQALCSGSQGICDSHRNNAIARQMQEVQWTALNKKKAMALRAWRDARAEADH
jgi:hypothetical protein